MKIKLFTSKISVDDLENKIANWIKNLEPKIIKTEFGIKTVKQLNDDGDYYDSWIEYTISIVYDINDLQHYFDTTKGLWATDKPDLISDPKKILFQL